VEIQKLGDGSNGLLLFGIKTSAVINAGQDVASLPQHVSTIAVFFRQHDWQADILVFF